MEDSIFITESYEHGRYLITTLFVGHSPILINDCTFYVKSCVDVMEFICLN